MRDQDGMALKPEPERELKYLPQARATHNLEVEIRTKYLKVRITELQLRPRYVAVGVKFKSQKIHKNLSSHTLYPKTSQIK
jgi:hypothetical protein